MSHLLSAEPEQVAPAILIRVFEVRRHSKRHPAAAKSFVEECVVRRELSDNFCFYNHAKYDSVEGASQWAQTSLAIHANDVRDHVYSLEQLESWLDGIGITYTDGGLGFLVHMAGSSIDQAEAGKRLNVMRFVYGLDRVVATPITL